ncbi:Chromosome partition protein Smc [compost metagenome]
MSEQILTQILEQLKTLNIRVDSMDSRLDSMDSRLDSMDSRFDGMDSRLDGMDSRLDSLETDISEIKTHTKDIPAIKQAVLETLDLAKQNKSSLHSFERKVSSELTTHGHSIDILNRRQLKLEADLENLKNR